MSDIARATLERMNLREVAIARHYTSLAADMRSLAAADPIKEHAAFLARRGELCEAFGFKPVEQTKPFAFAEGIAILPVSGTLINRFGGSYGYVTGYNFIRQQISLMMSDPDVKGIFGDINSYGGEAAGCFECASDIAAMRGTKPMIAVIDSNCYSAAYAIASAFDQIYCTPSGGAGSIGVVAMHISIEDALKEYGVKVTLIHSGDHKVDGNMFEDLPKAVKQDIQEGCDKSRDLFVELVSENRGLPAVKVRNTEARCYRAEEARELGLIDNIGTPSAAMRMFQSELNGSSQSEDSMSGQQGNTNSGVASADQVTAAAAASAAVASEQAKLIAEATSTAQKAERARVGGILTHAEAAGRGKLANHIAMNTGMSVEDAGAMLATAPKEATASAGQGTDRFAQAMNTSDHPNVGADGGNGKGEEASGEGKPSDAQMIIADQQRATGMKLVSANK